MSMIEDVARRVRELRATQDLSLEALADRSGVSRSMISVIERGESSPTAVVLAKLAAGLGVSMASLFETPQPKTEPLARRADQRSWQDPESGYVRRNISPSGVASPIHVVEVSFPAQARVAYETGAPQVRVHQQVWVLDGSLDVTVGDDRYRLDTGDCLAMILDRPIVFSNPTRRVTHYVVVTAAG